MKWLDPIRPYLAAIKLAAFLLLILAAYLYGRADGKEAGRRAVEAVELKQAKADTKTAQANQQAAQDAADRYRIKAESNAAVAENYLRLMTDANRKHNGVVADLRAGNIRLQKQWRGCQVSSAGETAAGQSGADEGAGLREEGAAAFVRDGAECDAKIISLQAQVACDRGDTSKCPITP